MAIEGVSTYAIFQSTLNDVGKVESELTQEQEQLSSGNNAQNFSQMSGQTQQYLSLDATISRLNQYADDNQVVETRVNTTSSTLASIITTANNLQGLISQRLSGVNTTSSFESQLTGVWQQLAGQLNATVGDQYIFSGTATGTPPVNAAQFPTLQQSGTPDASYYQGSNQDISARIDDNITVTTNVRADAPPFQQLIAGLAMAQEGDTNNDQSELSQAENFVQQALSGITSTQSAVNSTAAQLANVDTSHNSLKLYWQGVQQTIGNTDIVSVSTQVAVNQGILQAAFEAFAKISSLQLSNYLK